MKIRLAICILILCLFGALPADAKKNQKKILVIHSYDPGHVSMPKRNAGLEKVFSAAPQVGVAYFYMDTKRKSDLGWKHKIGIVAGERIASYRPDVVIAFDDNALRYAMMPYLGAERPQVVVAGINGELSDYGLPASNVTGILERTYPDQSLDMLTRIYPLANKVVCISDDSTTSDKVIGYIQSGKMPLEISAFEQPATYKEWKQTVLRYEKDAMVQAFLIPLYQTVKSDQGHDRINPSEVMGWTVANVTKPVVGLWPFATKDGALCAVTVDMTEHGLVAGERALQILSGKKASQIPIVNNKDGFVILNIRAAKRLGVHVPFEVIQAADRLIE